MSRWPFLRARTCERVDEIMRWKKDGMKLAGQHDSYRPISEFVVAHIGVIAAAYDGTSLFLARYR